jgi:hypothetical protein
MATVVWLWFSVAQASTISSQQQLAVSLTAGFSSQPAEHYQENAAPVLFSKEGRVMRRQFERHDVSADHYESQLPGIDVNFVEGSQLPWRQQDLAHPSLHTDPENIDPCYAQSWNGIVKTPVQIPHNECLNSLNLPQFLLQLTVRPSDDSAQHSLAPLHFSGQATSPTDIGISIGAGPSSSTLRVALADGQNWHAYDFPLGVNMSKPSLGQRTTFAFECAKIDGGRDCRVAVNGTLQGNHHFPGIVGNLYNVDGGEFGNTSGWSFGGYLDYLQVCNAAPGGLFQTTFTTTWVQNAAKCAGRQVFSVSDREVTCDSLDCARHGLIHVSNASAIVCRWRIYCKELFDLHKCCTTAPSYFDNRHELNFLYALGGLLGGFTALAISINLLIWLKLSIFYIARRIKVSKLLEPLEDSPFIEVPDKIDAETGMLLRMFAQALRRQCETVDTVSDFDDFWPEIIILSPLGRRKEDSVDCGPGMYHVLPIVIRLLKAGIPCFTGLMVPAEDEEKAMISKLTSPKSRCKILIVIRSAALYDEKTCLSILYGAQKRNVPHILPLSYASDLPDKSAQWPMIAPTEFELLSMRMSVQYHVCKLDAVPEAPATVLDDTKVLRHIVKFVKKVLLETYDVQSFMLNVPQRISADAGWELRRQAQALLRIGAGREPRLAMSNFWPEVFISYALGQRKEHDADGCGPGMHFVLAVTAALLKAGIPCFSNIFCEAKDKNPICTKLRSEKSKCKVFIVVQNEDLFNSRLCLEEIHTAQEYKIPCLLPLSFGQVPEKDQQWTMIKASNKEWIMKRDAVHKHFGKLKAVPEPPSTVLGAPEVFKDIIKFVESSLECERQKAQAEAEASRKKKEEEEEEAAEKKEDVRQGEEEKEEESIAKPSAIPGVVQVLGQARDAQAQQQTAGNTPTALVEISAETDFDGGPSGVLGSVEEAEIDEGLSAEAEDLNGLPGPAESQHAARVRSSLEASEFEGVDTDETNQAEVVHTGSFPSAEGHGSTETTGP